LSVDGCRCRVKEAYTQDTGTARGYRTRRVVAVGAEGVGALVLAHANLEEGKLKPATLYGTDQASPELEAATLREIVHLLCVFVVQTLRAGDDELEVAVG
jgi:hypothetical protein